MFGCWLVIEEMLAIFFVASPEEERIKGIFQQLVEFFLRVVVALLEIGIWV